MGKVEWTIIGLFVGFLAGGITVIETDIVIQKYYEQESFMRTITTS